MWGFEEVEVWAFEKKVKLFEFMYIIVNLWENIIKVCERYDDCESFFNFFKRCEM